MKQNGVVGGLLIDFLVPACLASRYRARLTALSPAEAELSLSFCPSIFRSGALTCCPAEISAVFGASAVRVRGSFHLEFSHYAEVPHALQEKVIAQSKSKGGEASHA